MIWLTMAIEPAGVAAIQVEHLVTETEIIRFAQATGSSEPIHVNGAAAVAAGYRGVVAPPFFFQVLGFRLGRDVPRWALSEDGTPLSDELSGRKVIAGETAVTWYGEIIAGDLIQVTQRLISIEHKSGSRGALDVYVYERVYTRDGSPILVETYTRIAQ